MSPARGVPQSYRKIDNDYAPSSASQTYSDRSHIYESIGDGEYVDSLKTGSSSGVYAPGSGVGVPTMATLCDADFCNCECATHYDYGAAANQDGYYSDRSTQTLPIRHLRHVIDQESPFAGHLSSDFDESFLKRPDSRLSIRSRGRTSTGSHCSDRSVTYQDGQRRRIPALHPNYFDPPEPEPGS